MKCPKCKTDVSINDTFCPNCNLRLVIECPKCKSKVRLGSASCKTCGYVFVKFCPKCNSANYISSQSCRKCFYVFEDLKDDIHDNIQAENELKRKTPVLLKQENKNPPKTPLNQGNGRLEVLIDFINLNSIFKKFQNEEFKGKVLLNIKTSIKTAFGSTPEFYKENIVKFKVPYNKNNGIKDKIEKFNSEMEKFNSFLNETLSVELSHKFVILQSDEIEFDKPVMQLAIGKNKDIITSKAAYEALSEEIPLVKVSPDSYKMANLEREKQITLEVQEINEDEAIEKVFETLTVENDIKGISINAPRGTGKTYILGELYKKLEKVDIAILNARCSAMSQVAPMGLFQDAFLNMFNLPYSTKNYGETSSNLRSLIQNYLPQNFNKQKIETLINLLYPMKQAYYETLSANREKTFEDIKDILEALRLNSKLLIAVDDFDLIDEMSFDFLTYLIENNFFTEGSKFLICYRNQNSMNMYIPENILPHENCLDITIKKREIGSTRNFIKKHLGEVSVCPRKISDQIIMNAKGDLSYTGQVLFHLIETKKIKLVKGKFEYSKKDEDYFVPQTMADLMKERLSFLYQKTKLQFFILCLASFLGGKFTKSILQDVIEVKEDEFKKAINSLIVGGYISKIDEENYTFKNSLVWTNIYMLSRENPEMKPYIEALLRVLLNRANSSPALCALLAQIVDNKELAFKIWTQNLQLSSAIGDSALYIISQKQSLINIDNSNNPNENYIKGNIFERLGKLTYQKNPQDAVGYLSNVIVEAKKQNDNKKVIELSGYLSEACRMSQKYTNVIETVDNVLELFTTKAKSELQTALIKTRKLEALLNTGNYEEVINTVNTEVNPNLSDAIKANKKLSYISKENLYSTWINSNIILAEAYTYQGSPLSFELISLIEKEIFKDKKNVNIELEKKLKLTCALSYTAKGIYTQSDDILHTLIKEFSKDDNLLISKWNMITIFNKILRMDFENIKEDLFEAVTYANNIGDNLVKNILKTVLAYVILEEDDPLRALEICQEQMAYFSNEKIALGALIAWYVSAKATLKTQGPDKALEICEKSIEIAQNSRINSTWFKILFQLLVVECYIIKDDLESAKMHVELASQDVNQNELNHFMLKIIRLKAIIMQESVDKVEMNKKAEVAGNASALFEKAITLSSRLGLENMNYKLHKELTSFKASCKLKRINV